MNVLLLTEVYPPEPVVGSFRAQKVARALAAAGHQVWVVASHAGAASTAALPAIPGVTLVVAPPWRSPIQLAALARSSFRGAYRLLFGNSPAGNQASDAGVVAEGGDARRRAALVDLLCVPDESQGLIPAMLRAVHSIPKVRFDLMYSTSPSHSVQLAALILANRHAIPWIAEFRDPWIDNPGVQLIRRSRMAQKLDERLERAVLRKASAIVAVTSDAGTLFRRKVEDDEGKVAVAFNGIGRVESSRAPRGPTDPLRLVYAGSIYPPRTPMPFLESLARVRGACALPIEVTMVGDCRTYDGIDVEALCRNLGLQDVVRFLEWVPREVAQELVNGADLLLLPAQQWVHQIPNKAFDYLGSRVPVLALCEPESELARLMAAVGGHTVVEEISALDGALRGCLTRATESRGLTGDAGVLATLTVEVQMRKVVELAERVGGRSAS